MFVENLPKILMCGSVRSGTTILAHMLSEHSELLITSEMYAYKPEWAHNFFAKIDNLIQHYPDVDRFKGIYTSTLNNMYPLFLKAINQKVMSPFDVLNLLYCLAQKRVKYYGDKLPEYTFELPRYMNELNKPKIIFCMRDPRDVIESQIRSYKHKKNVEGYTQKDIILKHWWCRPTIEACINMDPHHTWLDFMKEWEKAKSTLNMDYYELRYNQLVINSQEEATNLAEFLGVDAHELRSVFGSMFKPTRHRLWKTTLPDVDTKLPDEWRYFMNKYKLSD